MTEQPAPHHLPPARTSVDRWSWDAYLTGAPTQSRFPRLTADDSASETVKRVAVALSAETSRMIEALAAAERTTTGVFLATVVQATLSRSADQPDVLIAYRTSAAPAVRTLPLLWTHRRAETFRDRLRHNAAAEAAAGTTPAGRVPVPRGHVLVTETARHPSAPSANAAEKQQLDHDGHEASFRFHPGEGRTLVLAADYRGRRFDTDGAALVTGRLLHLIDAVARAPGTPVHDLPVVPPEERARLHRLTATGRTRPDAPRLHDLVREQVRRTPDAIAVQDEHDELTYRGLLEQAEAVAHRLRLRGAGPDTVVAVCALRSAALAVALLGVLLADSAYLPLDAGHPPQRIRDMLAETGTRVLLADEHGRDAARAAAPDHVTVLPLDASGVPAAPARPADATSPGRHRGPRGDTDLAYVIYTSGSTGRPKGVAVEHRGIVNRLLWMQSTYRLRPDDVVLQKTPYTFDVSVWEFFWPIISGARLVMARPGGHQDPRYLTAVIQEAGVTTVHFVPSMLGIFVEEPSLPACRSLRRVFCSGEALPASVANRFQRVSGAELHNLYGPTEASVDVTHWPCRRVEPAGTVPIGYPIDNVGAYVLDRAGRPAPLGAPGELWLGGIALARGYFGRPGLTAERFVPDPTGSGRGRRLYRTGDLARWHPQGHLEFLGRLDHQAKVNGVRVEPGEIEAQLRRHPAVREAVVTVRHDMGTAARLVGYVVPASGEPASAAELARHSADYLPEYMVPSAFVTLDSWPLTSSGKLDREALPKPQLKRRRR
ncbi:amino acid adenylation domain-containing protein [Streptomyces sp. NPDC032940]|uniref:amino acid adenylation domain-containing protein n=1 Tax=Streptomyces sp. NPDC032940 TaxID=3155366 RepID=UPI0033CA4BBC